MKVKKLRIALHRERAKKMDTKSLKLKHALNCLQQYLPQDTMTFIESQVVMSMQNQRNHIDGK